MKRVLFFVALAAALSGAYADDITIDPQAFTGTRTRAEVEAELAQFRQSGVNPWATGYDPLKAFQSGAARADVQQRFQDAREEVRARGAEDGGALSQARQRVNESRPNLAGPVLRLR